MMLAGVQARDQDVLHLARLLHEAGFDDRGTLVVALESEQAIVALTIREREAILRTLDDPPTDELAELRGVLLREHEWRVREGLA